VIAIRAAFDGPRETVQFNPKLLAAERRRRGTPRGIRALTCFWQAVLRLCWFRDRTSQDALARDHGISRATAYRYLDKMTEVLAVRAPDLREALDRAIDEGLPHVVPDGTLIRTDGAGRRPPASAVARGRVVLRQGPLRWRQHYLVLAGPAAHPHRRDRGRRHLGQDHR
jgi:hypothetical protein